MLNIICRKVTHIHYHVSQKNIKCILFEVIPIFMSIYTRETNIILTTIIASNLMKTVHI